MKITIFRSFVWLPTVIWEHGLHIIIKFEEHCIAKFISSAFLQEWSVIIFPGKFAACRCEIRDDNVVILLRQSTVRLDGWLFILLIGSRALHFAAPVTPPELRNIRIFPTTQHAWRPITFRETQLRLTDHRSVENAVLSTRRYLPQLFR